MEWIEPITDRTQTDVSDAIAAIKSWRGHPEEAVELKGCFNATDMNRIEGNIGFLAEKFAELTYPVEVSIRTWEKKDAPKVSDVNRIMSNLRNLSYAFTDFGFPAIPSAMLDFQEINDVETIIYQVNRLLDIMTETFKKCGTFKSGQAIYLPLRRT